MKWVDVEWKWKKVIKTREFSISSPNFEPKSNEMVTFLHVSQHMRLYETFIGVWDSIALTVQNASVIAKCFLHHY